MFVGRLFSFGAPDSRLLAFSVRALWVLGLARLLGGLVCCKGPRAVLEGFCGAAFTAFYTVLLLLPARFCQGATGFLVHALLWG